ncbi:coatomer subunit delta-like protein [Leptotrombidium deliense]|uniref:Coatomer subunit delta n=1 Tax=Leptotrombidium deliense TaxID=299467 RepID=A0A443SJV4_9ACAR|nr:coatomer subunit delta-like protein [Leptotrombidium deliense]
MVLLAAAIVSKQNGKILVSRQFVEMSRSRIEGLLTAFTKLITKDKQHTFIETNAVRYVYQALMDRLYCVLITTKTSNILEDLETMRLFIRVINEYTSNTSKSTSDEQQILDNAFTLIFAFDEIVALGYRESVNMSQVRTFIEMDSHEERVYVAVRQTQEREAKQKMREKAKELSKLQRTQQLAKNSNRSAIASNVSASSNVSEFKEPVVGDRAIGSSVNTVAAPVRPKALKLGQKSGQGLYAPVNDEQLASELRQEEAKWAPEEKQCVDEYEVE